MKKNEGIETKNWPEILIFYKPSDIDSGSESSSGVSSYGTIGIDI